MDNSGKITTSSLYSHCGHPKVACAGSCKTKSSELSVKKKKLDFDRFICEEIMNQQKDASKLLKKVK